MNKELNLPLTITRDASIGRDECRAATQADLDIINRKFALKPQSAEDIAVFRLDLVNDKVDRHFSRFPEKELQTINRLVVGKALMVNHDMPGGMSSGSLPKGRFFQSQVTKTRSGQSVQPDVYIVRTDENTDFIKNIEAGVYFGTSIGFSFERAECSICETDLMQCAHWPGERYDGKVCHYVMHGVDDVHEGSVVPLGSQSTEFVAARSMTDMLRDVRGTEPPKRDAEPELEPVEEPEPTPAEILDELSTKRRQLRDEDGELI